MTIERFKSHFNQKGNITDAKLMHTSDGHFRRFGFIGYSTEKEAQSSINYFDSTFIDTCQIKVQLAKAINDDSINRPWSKYSKGSSAYQTNETNETNQKNERNENKENKGYETHHQEIKGSENNSNENKFKKTSLMSTLNQESNDPKLKEFLQVMHPRSKTKTWNNDDVLVQNLEMPCSLPLSDDDELYQELPRKEIETPINQDEDINVGLAHDIKVSDMDYFASKKTLLDDQSTKENNELYQIESNNEIESKRNQTNDNETIPNPIHSNETLSNLTHLNDSQPSDTISNTQYNDTPSSDTQNDSNHVNVLIDTGRLFVKNLPYSCTIQDLEALFKNFGPVSEVHLPLEKDSKKPKGYAFILFLIPEHAVKAYTSLDRTIFQGRIIDIIPAQEKPKPFEMNESINSSFKSNRNLNKKSDSMKEFSWNSLFMNSDSVVSAMADKLGVKKSDILNIEDKDMAVKLSLAETQIINETKEYLNEQGIDLDSFMLKQRSKTIIIVKNLPFHVQVEEVEDLFSKFGLIGRVILPPTRTICIVEFIEPGEAKVAFKSLAYTRFKSLPLYLEWAPENMFTTTTQETKKETTQQNNNHNNNENNNEEINNEEIKEIKDIKNQGILEDSDDKLNEELNSTVPTLYVKNLNFSTTELGFKNAFSHLSGFKSARLATKLEPKTNIKQSMGFGFIEFENKENTKQAMKAIQGTLLDGHLLSCKLSQPSKTLTHTIKRPISENPESTKIMIRNIPFEATKREMRSLFSPFGQIKAIRIPKKMDGDHRGFGFIHFLTKQEAKSAFNSLKNTHFYGRHLVLEWAKEDENINELRHKTKLDYESLPVFKRKKLVSNQSDEIE